MSLDGSIEDGCNICGSYMRPVKFWTDRIHVCQWCVSLLCSKPIDPDKIFLDFERKIQRYLENKYRLPSLSYLESRAKKDLDIDYNPSLIDRLFRAKEIDKISKAIDMRVSRRVKQLLDEEKKCIEEKRNEAYTDIVIAVLSRDNPPQEMTYFNSRTGAVGSSDIVDPTTIKYVNAMHKNLIVGMLKSDRPDKNEWFDLRSMVLKCDGYRCRICGKYPKEIHVHHIIPLSKFGSNHPSNLITLCYSCHNKQHPDFKVSRRG